MARAKDQWLADMMQAALLTGYHQLNCFTNNASDCVDGLCEDSYYCGQIYNRIFYWGQLPLDAFFLAALF